jgi:uncharacterized protein YjbI with pentapeptide repeats
MSAQKIILNHDKWRKGIGGAPAGLAGENDGNAYAGLDLNLITFASCVFDNSSFAATTFRQAGWTGCQFRNCSFSNCDFEDIKMTGCTFTNCVFTRSQFHNSQLRASKFDRCAWNELNFDSAQWFGVDVLDCTGTGVEATDLRGEQVAFTGSSFEHTEFMNARIN